MWTKFGIDPYNQAVAAQLLPGDGIARRVFVFEPPGPARELEQRLELLALDTRGFSGRDPSGMKHACRWDEAVAYEKRHEC